MSAFGVATRSGYVRKSLFRITLLHVEFHTICFYTTNRPKGLLYLNINQLKLLIVRLYRTMVPLYTTDVALPPQTISQVENRASHCPRPTEKRSDNNLNSTPTRLFTQKVWAAEQTAGNIASNQRIINTSLIFTASLCRKTSHKYQVGELAVHPFVGLTHTA